MQLGPESYNHQLLAVSSKEVRIEWSVKSRKKVRAKGVVVELFENIKRDISSKQSLPIC